MRILFLAFLLCFQALAQTAALMPAPKAQFFDDSGRPLAGGKLYTYIAGTSTPVATYTDSTGTVANTNPVVLDAGGRGQAWLITGRAYKFVLQTSAGTGIWTVDNVTSSPLDTAFVDQPETITSPWNFSGTATFQNVVINGTTSGTGGGSSSLSAINVTQSGSDTSGRGGYIDFSPITYPNSTCLDVNGNIVNQPLAATGSPAFGANDAILWVSQSPLAGVTPPGCATAFTPNETYGLNLNTYLFVMGGVATNQPNYNAFDSMAGGMHALSFSANSYINAGHHAGVPTLTTGDSFNGGALYYDDTAGCMRFYSGPTTPYDPTHWSCFGSGGGGGGGSTAPGGIDYSIQINHPVGTFFGDAVFSYAPSSGIVTLAGAGYFQSTSVDGGFNATASTHPDAIQALNGGVTAKWLIATDTATFMEEASTGASSAGQIRLFAQTNHQLMVSKNAGSYLRVSTNTGTLTNGHCASFDADGNVIDAGGACTTGGGGGTVASAGQKALAYYTTSGTGTTVGGSSYLYWDNAAQLLTVVAGSSSVAGLAVSNGFIQSDAGFLSGACSRYNCFQATSPFSGSLIGGMAALSFTAQNYIQAGSSSGPPTPTTGDTFHPGALSWDTSGTPAMKVYNGSSWVPIGSGGSGITSLNSLTGALALMGTSNEITVTPSGSILTLSTPQAIGPASAVTFGSVTTSVFNSTATGAAYTFQNANYNFIVDGNGNVSSASQINLTGGSSTYKMGGTTVVDSSRNGSFVNLTAAGTTALHILGLTQCLQVSATGVVSGTGTLCGSGGGSLPVSDATSIVYSNGDNTKLARFDATNISHGTTRVYSLPDTNMTLAGIDVSQTYTGQPTFNTGAIGTVFNATSTGTGITFQNSNTNFQVNGNGVISGQQLNIAGNTVITTGRVAGFTSGSFISSSPSGNVLFVDNTGTSGLGIVDVTPGGSTFNRINAFRYFGGGGTPTVTGTGCSLGTGSTDTRGLINFPASGLCQLAFASAYSPAPVCTLAFSGQALLANISTTQFTIFAGPNAGFANYICMQ